MLKRSGQTEAAVDLARLAGLAPAGVVCEIMNEDGTMARVSDLIGYCERHGLKMVTVADLIEYRRQHENLVERVASVRLPTAVGVFQAVAYEEVLTGKHHVALVKGDVDGAEDVLVRVHSECLTGDVFHSQRCDCGEQLDWALRRIEEEGLGVLLYLAQEGRGIGLLNKLRAYELQEQGLDTVEANLRLGFAADAREYGIGSQILADLGLTTIRVLTNNPKKISGISGFGLSVVSQEPIEIEPNPENREYLESKRDKMGHTIELHEQPPARAVRSRERLTGRIGCHDERPLRDTELGRRAGRPRAAQRRRRTSRRADAAPSRTSRSRRVERERPRRLARVDPDDARPTATPAMRPRRMREPPTSDRHAEAPAQDGVAAPAQDLRMLRRRSPITSPTRWSTLPAS